LPWPGQGENQIVGRNPRGAVVERSRIIVRRPGLTRKTFLSKPVRRERKRNLKIQRRNEVEESKMRKVRRKARKNIDLNDTNVDKTAFDVILKKDIERIDERKENIEIVFGITATTENSNEITSTKHTKVDLEKPEMEKIEVEIQPNERRINEAKEIENNDFIKPSQRRMKEVKENNKKLEEDKSTRVPTEPPLLAKSSDKNPTENKYLQSLSRKPIQHTKVNLEKPEVDKIEHEIHLNERRIKETKEKNKIREDKLTRVLVDEIEINDFIKPNQRRMKDAKENNKKLEEEKITRMLTEPFPLTKTSDKNPTENKYLQSPARKHFQQGKNDRNTVVNQLRVNKRKNGVEALNKTEEHFDKRKEGRRQRKCVTIKAGKDISVEQMEDANRKLITSIYNNYKKITNKKHDNKICVFGLDAGPH